MLRGLAIAASMVAVGGIACGADEGTNSEGRRDREGERRAEAAFFARMGAACEKRWRRWVPVSARIDRLFLRRERKTAELHAQLSRILRRHAADLAELTAPPSKAQFLAEFTGYVREEARNYLQVSRALATGRQPPYLDLRRPRDLQVALVDEQGGRPEACGGPPL